MKNGSKLINFLALKYQGLFEHYLKCFFVIGYKDFNTFMSVPVNMTIPNLIQCRDLQHYEPLHNCCVLH